MKDLTAGWQLKGETIMIHVTEDELTDTEQIALCQEPILSYMAAHADAERRTKMGQRQVYCRTCQRWIWPDCLCLLADTKPTVLP